MSVLERGPNGATALFSDDLRYRYTLRRVLREGNWRIVWLLLNPSTADAFKPDPTVSRCIEWTRRWGADIADVVNAFALRSPYPTDLYEAAAKNPHRIWTELGADEVNDNHIRETCAGAKLVIAGWGNHGDDPKLGRRGEYMRQMLRAAGITLHHFGVSKSGSPLHPLARGKSFVPYDREPTIFEAA